MTIGVDERYIGCLCFPAEAPVHGMQDNSVARLKVCSIPPRIPSRRLGAFYLESQNLCMEAALVSDDSTALAFTDAPQHGAGLSHHAPSTLRQRPEDSHSYDSTITEGLSRRNYAPAESFTMQVYTESRSQLIKAVLRTLSLRHSISHLVSFDG